MYFKWITKINCRRNIYEPICTYFIKSIGIRMDFYKANLRKKHHTFCFLEGNYVRRWRSDFYLKQIIVTTRFKYWKNLNGYEKSLHPKFICFKIGVLNTKHVVLKYFANFANIHIDRKHPRKYKFSKSIIFECMYG